MAEIDIPQEHQDGIKALVSMSASVFERLIAVLDEIEPSFRKKELLERVVSKFQDISKDKLLSIIETAMSLHSFRGMAEISISQLLSDTLSDDNLAQIDISDSAAPLARNRMKQVLLSKSLWATAKGSLILTANERTFYRARIFTDIRPVFRNVDGPDKLPSAISSVLIHTLRMRCVQNGERKDFFFSLDPDDVDTLIEVLERARVKASQLKQRLKGTELEFIDGEVD